MIGLDSTRQLHRFSLLSMDEGIERFANVCERTGDSLRGATYQVCEFSAVSLELGTMRADVLVCTVCMCVCMCRAR